MLPDSNWEFINWITSKHYEFRKINNIPPNCSYNEEMKAKFINSIGG